MTYFCSDLHGEYTLFLELLKKINFSSDDKMIICGDLIDKGNQSVKLVRFIASQKNIKCILGNHEFAFLKYFNDLSRFFTFGDEYFLSKLQEYFPFGEDALDWKTVDYLQCLPLFIEEKDFICVHAGIPQNSDGTLIAVEDAPIEFLLNDRTFKDSFSIKTNKCVFFGHSPTSYCGGDGEIMAYLKAGRTGEKITDFFKIHLDTGVYISGVMGCYCLENGGCCYVRKQKS